jgi:hypothetical protein
LFATGVAELIYQSTSSSLRKRQKCCVVAK